MQHQNLQKVPMKRHFTFVGTFLEGARRYACEKGLWTGPHSCGYRKVTMKRRFSRHLPVNLIQE